MSKRIILAEINEITWDLIDPLIKQGKLPTFATLKRDGAWGAPLCIEVPPQLDPWITWTTVYTGRPQSEHNVFFLQQPPQSIHAKRLWEICASHGRKVGVYGSVCSWPPQKVDGYYVPDTFAQDASTYPENLQPIQQLNLTYTRSVRLPSDQDTLGYKIKLCLKLASLGLNAEVMTRLASQLAAERFDSSIRWKRVSLQPLVNFAFFSRLHRKHRPDFATFHTNHVAHYQHTYWKAMQPDRFQPLETSAEEQKVYGGAIEHGYRTADLLLKKLLALLDDNTVLIVASSMGQKPFISSLEGGKQIAQLRSHAKLLEILGVEREARFVPTMSDEFNIYCNSGEVQTRIVQSLRAAYIDVPNQPVFHIEVLEEAIRVNLYMYDFKTVVPESRLHFPLAPGAPAFSYDELIYSTGHVKSGCHDPKGILMVYGAGVPKGIQLSQYTTLDFAPTILTLMDLPVPPEMKGRVMSELVSPIAAEPVFAQQSRGES